MAAPSTLKVYNVLRQQDGTPLVNANVHLILDYNQATVTATGDDIIDLQQSATTDATGTYTFTVVPTDLMSPSNLTYTVVEPNRTYQIAPLSTGGTLQQTTAAGVIVNLPSALAPAVQGAAIVTSLQISGGQPGRYVPNPNAYGAPTSGTYLKGDWTISNASGSVFVCTVAGSPGTWVVTGGQFNVLDYGAKGDGVTDDSGAINAAISAAATSNGTVFLPPATYAVSSKILVKNKVALVGAGRDATVIRALATFPTSTEVVRLGDTTSIVFACRVENLTVDCNNVAGGIGIYSERINEQSGAFRVLVNNALAYGIQIKQPASGQPAQNYSLDDVEIYPGASALAGTIGIGITNTSITAPCRVIQRVTVVSSGATLTAAVKLDGMYGRVSDIHIENAVNGILVGSVQSCGGAHFIDITGLSNVTNLLVWSNATGQNPLTALGVSPNGGTNSLVDQLTGRTLTNAVGFYAYGTGGAGGAPVVHSDVVATQRFVRVQMLKDFQRSAQAVTLNGGTVTIDATAGEYVIATLSASTTIAISNASQGQELILRFQHDATANAYTITWPVNIKRAGGSFPNTNSANAQDTLTIAFDGSNWQEKSRAINLL